MFHPDTQLNRIAEIQEIHASNPGLVMSYFEKYICGLVQPFHVNSRISPDYIFTLKYAVAQLVEALRYKPEGRGFDSRWSHWKFSVT
jgi:hypothetical protein